MEAEDTSWNASPLGHLPASWELARLKEITTKIGSGATPRGGQIVYLGVRKNAALIRSQNVFDRRFNHEGLAYITDDHAEQLSGAGVRPDDVLLNITGDGVTFGRACLAPEDVLPAYVNQHVSIIRPNRKLCCPGYLLSYLTHPDIKGYIESFNAGGSRRAITKGHIESFEVPLPPLAEQASIADTLGTLDDKIDLNRRMNETLEAIARTLFKSWFVDFDPVRAKMEGRQPAGMDAETAALFPTSFDDSRHGKIPKGWRVSEWGDLVRLEYGKSLRGYEKGKGPYTVFGTNGPIGQHDEPLCKHPGIVIGRKGAYRGVHYHNAPFFVIDTAYFIEPKGEVDLRWAYYQMRLLDINGMDSGSAIPSTSRDEFYRLSLVEPPVTLQHRFVRVLGPMWARLKANDDEARTLAALRDSLLPKLLSGEVRVKDVSSSVEITG